MTLRPRKEIYGDYNRWIHITKDGFRPRPWFHFYQAEKNGGCVLLGQAHWTKINGFSLRVWRYNIDVIFRRFSR